MKNLTNQELTSKAKTYDNIQNEGGEGYNPYREELERRALAAAQSAPKSPAQRKAEIYRELDRKDCSIARECGTFNQAEVDALRAELDQIEAAEESAFASEWTLEETKTRRENWNGFIKSLMDSNGKISGQDRTKIYQRANEQGWGLGQLKKAIKLHNL